MTRKIGLLLSLFLMSAVLIAAVAMGQELGPPQPAERDQRNAPNQPGPPNPPNPPPPDPLNDVMFPPDLVLGHARELRLTDEQKAFIRGEVQKTTASFNELQWKLQDQMEVLHETLKSSSVSEQQALAELNKVLDIEREIKRLHIGLGVRIKNHLTPEQQEQLQQMRMPPRAPQGVPRPPE